MTIPTMISMEVHLLEQLKEVRENWHAMPTPRGRTQQEITEWLDDNIMARYYWDDMNMTNTIGKVYLENEDDVTFYRMVWEEYL